MGGEEDHAYRLPMVWARSKPLRVYPGYHGDHAWDLALHTGGDRTRGKEGHERAHVTFCQQNGLKLRDCGRESESVSLHISDAFHALVGVLASGKART